jgi:hypothetical protein
VSLAAVSVPDAVDQSEEHPFPADRV